MKNSGQIGKYILHLCTSAECLMSSGFHAFFARKVGLIGRHNSTIVNEEVKAIFRLIPETGSILGEGDHSGLILRYLEALCDRAFLQSCIEAFNKVALRYERYMFSFLGLIPLVCAMTS